jgi:ubiquinol-cytochrome c reductase iron-sulfur subunit
MTSTPPARAPMSVVILFLLAALSAVAFAVCYGFGLGTPALGGSIGAAFAFLAMGLARWSALNDQEVPDYVEERAVGPTPKPQFEHFTEALTTQPVPRAKVLFSMLGLAFGTIGVAALFPLRSLLPSAGASPDKMLSTTPWRAGRRVVDEDHIAVRADDIETGSVMTVFPAGVDRDKSDASTLLIRVDPATLRLPPGREDWVVDGIVAYSKLCTHAGCPVGLYVDTANLLLCPCHHSIFDVLTGARPVEGPAPHPLPQLPLGVDDDGFLVARGDFSGPVGAAWWRYP